MCFNCKKVSICPCSEKFVFDSAFYHDSNSIISTLVGLTCGVAEVFNFPGVVRTSAVK